VTSPTAFTAAALALASALTLSACSGPWTKGDPLPTACQTVCARPRCPLAPSPTERDVALQSECKTRAEETCRTRHNACVRYLTR
jgi:hypothetical protein